MSGFSSTTASEASSRIDISIVRPASYKKKLEAEMSRSSELAKLTATALRSRAEDRATLEDLDSGCLLLQATTMQVLRSTGLTPSIHPADTRNRGPGHRHEHMRADLYNAMIALVACEEWISRLEDSLEGVLRDLKGAEDILEEVRASPGKVRSMSEHAAFVGAASGDGSDGEQEREDQDASASHTALVRRRSNVHIL